MDKREFVSQNKIEELIEKEKNDIWQSEKSRVIDYSEQICHIIETATEALADTVENAIQRPIPIFDSKELLVFANSLESTSEKLKRARNDLRGMNDLLTQIRDQITGKDYSPEKFNAYSETAHINTETQFVDYKIGDKVYHSSFGNGVVSNIVPLENDSLIEIIFLNEGTKECVMSSALNHLVYIGNNYSVENELEIVARYIKANANGNSDALYELGKCYYYGRGVKKDKEKAVVYYSMAAEQGNTSAQCDLAECYLSGIGISVNKSNGVLWYTKAAEGGNTYAQCRLAECYYNGIGVDKNKSNAVNWCEKAAKKGRLEARRLLAKWECDESNNFDELPF